MAKFFVILAFLGAAIAVGSAASFEEKNTLETKAFPVLEACGKELGIPTEDLLAARAAKNINAIDPCYFTCFFKKIGFMDDAGTFNVALAKEKVEKFLSDPKDLKKALEVGDTCSSVNSAVVSDGVKGCERAKLLAECMIKELRGYNF